MRDYTDRYVKSGTYIDIRLAGAFEALCILLHGKNGKTETINEMIERLLRENADLLRQNEDLVRRQEDKVREKFQVK